MTNFDYVCRRADEQDGTDIFLFRSTFSLSDIEDMLAYELEELMASDENKVQILFEELSVILYKGDSFTLYTKDDFIKIHGPLYFKSFDRDTLWLALKPE